MKSDPVDEILAEFTEKDLYVLIGLVRKERTRSLKRMAKRSVDFQLPGRDAEMFKSAKLLELDLRLNKLKGLLFP